jgi:chromosome partitioning protein
MKLNSKNKKRLSHLKPIVITTFNRKGGTGKSTMTGSIAFEIYLALLERGLGQEEAIAVIDRDPQGDLINWLSARDRSGPQVAVADLHQLSATLRRLKKEGVQVVLIDQPPGYSPLLTESLKNSDLALICSQPGQSDINATKEAIQIAEQHDVPYRTILNKGIFRAKITGWGFEQLENMGNFIPYPIYQRVEMAEAVVNNLFVQEWKKFGKSAKEVNKISRSISQVLDLGDNWGGIKI